MPTRSGTGLWQLTEGVRKVCNKWGILLADIYTENPQIPKHYWIGDADSEGTDYGTHLTPTGYNAFYIPTIHSLMINELNNSKIEALQNRVTRLETAFNSITIGGSY
jgi:hypothetical protein